MLTEVAELGAADQVLDLPTERDGGAQGGIGEVGVFLEYGVSKIGGDQAGEEEGQEGGWTTPGHGQTTIGCQARIVQCLGPTCPNTANYHR